MMNIQYIYSKILKKIQLPSIINSEIKKKSKVCSCSNIVGSQLGEYSYIGNYCTVLNTNIGKFCSISDNCVIGGAMHPYEWVSTSPVFYQGKNCLKCNFSDNKYNNKVITNIGHDVWIGSNCMIKGGLNISDGAVIGIGSVVTKDVGKYEIWAGNPAKFIKKRFSDDICNKLQESEWWNYSESKLKNVAQYYNSVSTFIDKYGN